LRLLKATAGSLKTQVAGCLVRQSVTTLQNPGPTNDPFRIVAETPVQMVVADNAVGNVTAGTNDLDAHQATAAGTVLRVTLITHVQFM
jgi:hypothetical protein